MDSAEPTAPRPPIDAILSPFQRFARTEASGGIVLLVCAAIALVAANSGMADQWAELWAAPIGLAVGGWHVEMALSEWINEGLMTIFFFVVGLEIRREILGGELSSRAKATLPIAAAIGGMIVPALIYLAFNPSGPARQGWAVPMATDIAFALGVLALAGSAVPTALKVFLTALAIVDDIGAVAVIALFYTHGIEWSALVVAAVAIIAGLAANRLGVRSPAFYGLALLLIWASFLAAGLHATLAGIVGAFLVPWRTRLEPRSFAAQARRLLDQLDESDGPAGPPGPAGPAQRDTLENLEVAIEHAQSPMIRLERTLHPYVAFGVMPLFALANAGVSLAGIGSLNSVAVGTAVALVLGKPLGILSFSALSIRAGWAALPESICRRQLVGASVVAGIGFTMSLFVASLAFDGLLLTNAKEGVLVGSTLAGVAGLLIIRSAGNGTQTGQEAGGEPPALDPGASNPPPTGPEGAP